MDGYTYLIKVDTNGNTVLPALSKNAKQADRSIGRIDSSSKKSFGTLGRSADRSNGILRKTKGLLAGIGLTLGAGALGRGIIKTGANFEKTMSSVQAKMRATDEDMESLTNSAREMGAATIFSASQSAEALDFMAMAGYDTGQAIEALPGTLNLAAASSMALGRSADIATNILSQFRKPVSETGDVVDKLAYTATSANTGLEEMADAMNYIGPTAASLNIPLSEMLSAVGVMADSGLKGSRSTRALRTSLTRLADPTNKMQEVMAKLNVDFYDAQGNFIGLTNMVEMLNSKMAGLSQQQRTAALSTLFGNEAITQMTVLLNSGADSLREFSGELDNANGAAKRMAETKIDNLEGDFTKLKSASQEVSLQLFEHLGPTLREITQEATLFVRSLDTETVGLHLKKTVLTLRKGMLWFQKHHKLVVGLVKGYVALKAGMLAYNIAIRASSLYTTAATTAKWSYIAATRGAAVATRALNTSLSFSPLGAIVGVISAAASAYALLANNTNKAKKAQKGLNNTQNRMQQREASKLKQNTATGLSKLDVLGDLNSRQVKELRRNAQLRLDTAEDYILNVKSKAKSSEEYKEYRRLKSKQNKADYSLDSSGKIKNPGLTTEELFRMRQLEREINALPKKETGLTLRELKKIKSKNKRILKQTAGLVPEDPTLSGSSSEPSPETTEMSKRVASGGRSQRVINITLEKFLDDMNFNVDSMEDIQAKAEEIKEIFTRQYMRVLNSANQMANG